MFAPVSLALIKPASAMAVVPVTRSMSILSLLPSVRPSTSAAAPSTREIVAGAADARILAAPVTPTEPVAVMADASARASTLVVESARFAAVSAILYVTGLASAESTDALAPSVTPATTAPAAPLIASTAAALCASAPVVRPVTSAVAVSVSP